ncbi:MAG: hypothetical protein V3S30_00890 [Thermoanaerobaculia bacterium]
MARPWFAEEMLEAPFAALSKHREHTQKLPPPSLLAPRRQLKPSGQTAVDSCIPQCPVALPQDIGEGRRVLEKRQLGLDTAFAEHAT